MAARRERGGGDRYYYAGGERVDLAPAEDVLAVDTRALAAADVPAKTRAAAERAARPLAGGVGLVHLSDLGDDAAAVEAKLRAAGVLHPVFRSHGALVVVLPEVRVEESRGAGQKRLGAWLRTHARDVVVESEADGRVVLRPASGYGGDALALANQLAEQVGPEMAQARFLRVTPRPSTMRG